MPANSATGTTHDSRSRRKVLSICPVTFTPNLPRSSAKASSTRVVVKRISPLGSFSFSAPEMNRSDTATSATLPSRSSCWNSL